LTIGKWVLVTDKREMEKKFGEFAFLSFAYASGYVVSIFFNSLLVFVVIGIKASRNIHNSMVWTIFKAPINLFFETNPTGAIMNRFSKDLGIIDTQITMAISFGMTMFYQTVSVLIVMAMVNPWFILLTPLLFLMAWSLFRYSVVAYRENTRIEAITRSPLLILLGETFAGNPTIKSFCRV